jgi:hypothetical protein
MVQSAIDWMLTRRDNNGQFILSDEALDSFGRAPLNTTNAYILWALTSANVSGLDKEIDYLKKQADISIQSNVIDTYYLSLVAATLYNVGRSDDARTYADVVTKFQLPNGLVERSLFTITMSLGENLEIETTSIATIAWLND